MDVLNRMEVGKGVTMLEVHLSAPGGGGWAAEIRDLPGVQDVELLDSTVGSETCRVYFRGRTFLPLLKRLRLVRHFPFPVQKGVATWTVVGPEPKVRALLKALEAEQGRLEVEAVHHGPWSDVQGLLTNRQQEVLRRAMAEGYFDVPRRISLTDLAAKMGVAISTLSVTLAVIEKKILEPHA